MFGSSLIDIIARLPALVIGVICHEGAHALAADRLGDPTPRRDGRLTFDPRAHLTQLGTLFILLGPFGWGRSVRYDPSRFYSPIRGAAKVAFAGPLMSTVIAATCALIHTVIFGSSPSTSLLSLVLINMVYLNFFLAFVNMLPFGSFDGNKVLAAISPKAAKKLSRLSLSGCTVLLIVLFFFRELLQLLFLPIHLLVSASLQGGLLVNCFVLLFTYLTLFLYWDSIKNEERSFAISLRRLLTVLALFVGTSAMAYGALQFRQNFLVSKRELVVEQPMEERARVVKRDGDILFLSVYNSACGSFETTVEASGSTLAGGDETSIFFSIDDYGRPTNVSMQRRRKNEGTEQFILPILLGLLPILLGLFVIWPGWDDHFGRAEILEDGVTIQGQFKVLSSTATKKVDEEGRKPE